MWVCPLVMVILNMMTEVSGHGRLIEPPGRSTMWRYGFSTPPNYSDNQLFCGGVSVQYSNTNKGRCGICGDPFNGVKANEAGGKYANGIIVREYKTAETLDIKIQVTANHKGWMEFKICPNNNVNVAAKQECLDRYPLEMADGQETKFPIASSMLGVQTFRVRLPAGLTCSQCVLQWRYHTGNSWGKDPDGTACVGCGNQEEFYACADIKISPTNVIIPMTLPDPAATMPPGNDPDMVDYVDWTWGTPPDTDGSTMNMTINPFLLVILALILVMFH